MQVADILFLSIFLGNEKNLRLPAPSLISGLPVWKQNDVSLKYILLSF